MNFEISKAFQKSFDRLKDKQLAAAILSVINEVNQAEQLSDITHLKKLKVTKRLIVSGLVTTALGYLLNPIRRTTFRYALCFLTSQRYL